MASKRINDDALLRLIREETVVIAVGPDAADLP